MKSSKKNMIKSVFNKFISILIIISFILPDYALCMRDSDEDIEQTNHIPISLINSREEIENVSYNDISNPIFLSSNGEEIEERNPYEGIPLKSFSEQRDSILEDEEFNEYLANLSNNSLVKSAKDHLDLISGKQTAKTHRIRNAAILFTLFAGATASCIGSLTFLIGKHFPEEFAEFADFSISDDAANGIGKYLGGSNMAVETLFYTYTIHGILSALQKKKVEKQPLETEPKGFFRRCCSKVTSWLPSVGEWGLAIASAIPLTLLSLIDQEQEGIEGLIYPVVGCIGLVTFLSNKFFLSLTHGQLKKVWKWVWSKKANNSQEELSPLEKIKAAFIESTTCSNEKINHLSKEGLETEVKFIREIAQTSSDAENIMPDRCWAHLINHMFEDLSFVPPRVNKMAIMLIPSLAVFTALSWLGLIATVPDGIEKKLSALSTLKYPVMVIAGIPLIEIGLSVGGSLGLQLSRIGDGRRSLNEQLTHWFYRSIGYIAITLAGLGSFATTATLTIQQFKAVPAICWLLLPSATLGMDLINISTGCEVWNEAVAAAEIRLNSDKSLFVNHVNFRQDFQKQLEITSAKEIALLLLNLDPAIQERVMRFIPSMEDADFQIWRGGVIKAIKEENMKEKIID